MIISLRTLKMLGNLGDIAATNCYNTVHNKLSDYRVIACAGKLVIKPRSRKN